MNEQEMFSRVGELAGRAGYPVPALSWVNGPPEQACIALEEDREGNATLVLHERMDERFSREEQDFLIAQQFVQAGAGRQRHLRRIGLAMGIVLSASCFVVPLLWGRLMDSAALTLLVAGLFGYSAAVFFQMVLARVWVRWFVRRVDKMLIEMLGRDHVLQVLRDQPACRPPTQLSAVYRRLMNGSPPDAPERLRMLGEPVVAGAAA